MDKRSQATTSMAKINCRAILFDWDGTLVNTLTHKIRNAGLVFARVLNFDPGQVEALYRKHSGVPRRVLFDTIAKGINGQHLEDEIFERISREFSMSNESLMDPSYVFPDVLPALDVLHHIGFTMFVSSSATPKDVKHAAIGTGLSKYFDEVLGSEKPFTKGRAHIAHVCNKMNIKTSEVCVVGDELADIRLAKEAGVSVVARVGSCELESLVSNGADRVIKHLDELSELIVMGRGEN